MSFDQARTELVLQFALLVAGEEDSPYDRQLGPIHLLKYVYLADLVNVRRNGGEIFTGADWRFHNFGPWSNAIHEVIDPALRKIGAEKLKFASDYGEDDWVRYSVRDDCLLTEKGRSLPACIAMELRRDVHKFGKDTPALLDYVYKTKPMLSASPNDYLDFSLEVESSTAMTQERQQLKIDKLSARKRKQFRERLGKLRKEHQRRKTARPNLLDPVASRRHDDIYEEGIAWLDQLAGPPIESGDRLVEFSGEVWNSPTRKGGDVS
ncbi:MAG: hypothetical protein OXQ89_06735 [Rhodospirillaceae bacterium]|nr:hypothetical protein [Rhodospirillaceae bacterium]MDD9997427.1 hypothetical protein [Rhodospirillaceae bacterium]